MVGQNQNINVTRALTRIKSVSINFDKARVDKGKQTPSLQSHKTFNDFFHSMGGNTVNAYDPGREVELQIQIGSKLFPEYPIRSLGEVFYQLKKTLGIHSSSFHNIDIPEAMYRNRKFIIGIDTEKVLSAGFTGLNTKAGDLMTIRVKQASTDDKSQADKMQIILHADMILNIRDTGVEVME